MIDLDKLLNISQATMKPAQGKVLISNPFLSDYFFRRSVVLLVDHGEDGSFGIIINKPLEFKLTDLTASFSTPHSKVYLGGPVKTDGLFYIHTLGELISDSLKIIDGLWWGGNPEALDQYLQANPEVPDDQIRFYLGYSGWVTDQLHDEVTNRSWMVADTTLDEVLGKQPDDLWSHKVRSLGERFDPWLHLPSDPAFN